jgi:hypothetical protein
MKERLLHAATGIEKYANRIKMMASAATTDPLIIFIIIYVTIIILN